MADTAASVQGQGQRTGDAGLPRSFDLCLLIPLREEFDYARDILRFGSPINDGSYFLHPFSIPDSSVTGVAVVLFEMGQASAAVAAARLLAVYDIRVLALVGIAGALSPKLRLGDVVIASSVDEYLHGAKARSGLTESGIDFEPGGVSWQATPEIVNYANNFRYLTGIGYSSWRDRARQRRDPGLVADVPVLARDYPDYLVGAIATGEIVSAAKSFADWLCQANRFRVAIEMEAGGAARAIYRHQARLIVVRGISDLADERKSELDATTSQTTGVGAWRKYATHNAVDLLAAMLANPQFPWPDISKIGQGSSVQPSDSPPVLAQEAADPAHRAGDSGYRISVLNNRSGSTFIGTTEVHGDLRIGGSP